MTTFQERLEKLGTLTIHRSSHPSFTSGHCALEVVAWLAGEKHSDAPKCTCQAIAAFIRTWNDGIPDDETRNRVLKPLLPLLLNTRGRKGPSGDRLLVRRSYLALDWDIRVRTPAFLRAAGLGAEAASIEALPEILNETTLSAAIGPTKAGQEKASAALSAALSAAWNAAASAARSAAWNAAASAAESAAGSAAASAARSAAASAALSAAASAARSAAWNAAWNAAESAAWNAAASAAESAAWNAAASALQAIVDALHRSASDLVRRMCALTEADVESWHWSRASA